MAVVSSCGGTTRGRSSPLSAHLQAGKGRNLTFEHAHRIAAALAQICLEQGNQGARSPKEAKEFQEQTSSRLLPSQPTCKPGLEQSQLEPRHNFSHPPPLGLTKVQGVARKTSERTRLIKEVQSVSFLLGQTFAKKSSYTYGVRHQQKRGTPTPTNFSRRVKLTSPKRH